MDDIFSPLCLLNKIPNTNQHTYFKPIEFKSFENLRRGQQKLFNEVCSNNMAHEVVVAVRKNFIDSYVKVHAKIFLNHN